MPSRFRFPALLLTAAVVVIVAVVFFTNMQSPAPVSTNAGVQQLDPTGYQSRFMSTSTQHVLLDVRTPEEFNSGHIPGAINISVQTLAERLNEIPRDQPIVVYCRSGNRSATAAAMLEDAGYTSIYDLGGIIAWSAAGLPIE